MCVFLSIAGDAHDNAHHAQQARYTAAAAVDWHLLIRHDGRAVQHSCCRNYLAACPAGVLLRQSHAMALLPTTTITYTAWIVAWWGYARQLRTASYVLPPLAVTTFITHLAASALERLQRRQRCRHGVGRPSCHRIHHALHSAGVLEGGW